MTRSFNYRFTVRMINGQVAPEDQPIMALLRSAIKVDNSNSNAKQYVKLQGRLGENNPNAWKYRQYRNGGIYGRAQCIRLADAATADVYVYNR